MLPRESAPIPDLRIVPTDNVYPHEEHDIQRAAPLIERIKAAEFFTNPPIVSSMGDNQYVVMDGANRHYSFSQLGFKHILVQVADYASDFVELGVWQHIISNWDEDVFSAELHQASEIEIHHGWDTVSTARILFKSGPVFGIHAHHENIHERNATLREVVHIYRQQARLYRTPLTDPQSIWALYPDAIALILFPFYQPEDIIAAATQKAFLPSGVSRHIIQGRALKLNYPMADLKANNVSLEAKNDALHKWLQQKLTNRSVRYYAESTYQFDE